MKKFKLKPSFMHIQKLASIIILVGCTLSVFAQTTSVTKTATPVKLDSIRGVVYDAITKKPIVGAQVQTLDAKYSKMTDESGSFAIGVPGYVHTLLAIAPDYSVKEVALYSSEKSIKIYLGQYGSANYYGEELTPVGMKRRSTVTTAQKTIEVDNLSSITIDADLQRKLGSDIKLTTHSGTLASGTSMLIRGINSLNANTQPLIVLDGLIQHNQSDIYSIHQGNIVSMLANIDVNDIASVSVLKDGTSLYGSKGGNGVLIINTNRGRDLTTKITVAAMLGSTLKPKVIPMMDADQSRIYISDLLSDVTAQKSVTDQLFLNTNTEFIYYNKFHNNANWSSDIYNNSLTQSYNVGVNGGDESALYNLSVGFANSPSVLKANDYNRLNARFNSDIILAKGLSTTFDISYLQSSRKLRNDGLAETYAGPINSPAFLALVKAPFLSPYQYLNSGALSTRLEDYDFMKIANPYAILEYGAGKSLQNNFNLSIQPTYKINKFLKISSQFSYTLNSLSENLFSPMYGVAPAIIDIAAGNSSKNHVKTQFAKQSTLFSDTRVNWKKNYEYNWFDVNSGVRYMLDKYVSEYAMGHNTGNDLVREMSGSLQFKSVGGILEPAKTLSYYAVVNYSLMNKYFLEGTVTAETNSKFGTDIASGFNLMGVSWGAFPSINASWLVNSEDFMKSLKFISLLKLRAGYGLSGNDGMTSTASQAYFNAIQYTNNQIGLQIYNIANPHLQWETVTKRSIGLDMNLFNDRIGITADLYNNTTDNLLVQKTLPVITGIGSYWSNDGKLENKGYELGLNVKVVETKDFHFTLGASVAHNANKILTLANGDYLTSVYGGEVLTAVGQQMGQFYGYQTNGVYALTTDATTNQLFKKESNGALTPYKAGDMRFVNTYVDNDTYSLNANGTYTLDANGTYILQVIDEKDKTVIGNSNAKFFGGMNAALKYKNLGIQFVFNYSYGNDVYNYLRSQIESGSTFYNQSITVGNRWIAEGQNATIPKSVYGDPMQNNRFSDRWIEDGSYLKLKTVEISYELPLKSSFIQGFTIWASANNLLTLTKYLGSDPEFAASNQIMYQGIDTGLLPQSKSFNCGFKINL